MSQATTPMTLGNTRANGVRALAVEQHHRRMRPVSKLVNSSRADDGDASLIEPVAA
jgi:hypothetical protein